MEAKEMEKLDQLRCNVADYTLIKMEDIDGSNDYDNYILININDYKKAKELYYKAYNEWYDNGDLQQDISQEDYIIEAFRNSDVRFMLLGREKDVEKW